MNNRHNIINKTRPQHFTNLIPPPLMSTYFDPLQSAFARPLPPLARPPFFGGP